MNERQLVKVDICECWLVGWLRMMTMMKVNRIMCPTESFPNRVEYRPMCKMCALGGLCCIDVDSVFFYVWRVLEKKASWSMGLNTKKYQYHNQPKPYILFCLPFKLELATVRNENAILYVSVSRF